MNRSVRDVVGALAALAFSITVGLAQAAPTAEEICQGEKNQAAGNYARCRQKAEKSLATRGDVSAYGTAISRCEARFALAWQNAIDKAARHGATCPDAPLTEADFKSVIDAHSTNIAEALAGGELRSPTCGDGVVDPAEDCDSTDLAGETCADRGFTYGTLTCGSDCALDTSGCSNERFVDTGNGTVIDYQHGLEWEKKTDDGSVHDKDNTYVWSHTGIRPDGTLFGDFLAALNNVANCSAITGPIVCEGSCFADHCDWRIPEIGELQTLASDQAPGCGDGSPCIEPILGPTGDAAWSATTSSPATSAFLYSYQRFCSASPFGGVLCTGPSQFSSSKTAGVAARAVRSSSP